MRAVAETVRERHGYINLLVNNAGLAKNFLPKLPGPGEVDMKKYQELLWNAGSPQDFSGAFEVNVAAVWYTAVCFLDLLLGRLLLHDHPSALVLFLRHLLRDALFVLHVWRLQEP